MSEHKSQEEMVKDAVEEAKAKVAEEQTEEMQTKENPEAVNEEEADAAPQEETGEEAKEPTKEGSKKFFGKKNKKDKRIIYLELTDEVEKQLFDYIQEIEALIAEEKPPECIHKNTCKKCAYYEYCYI